MNLVETDLTPELAARLLAGAHPKQRRTSRQQVDIYARAIREGRWRLVADAVLVDSDGHMFNGAHRCAAVIIAGQAIPVMICWEADPTTFDVIDIGRRRGAYQFVSESDAAMRASAARVTLWYEKRFDRLLQNRNINFDLHEILEEVESRAVAFDAMVPCARKTYDETGIPQSVSLGAYAIAFEMGYQNEVERFVDGIAEPWTLGVGEPARLLADRFRKQDHRARRRNPGDDWTILVRALNLHLEGRTADRLQISEFWPRVGELNADWNRRRNTASAARKAHAQTHVRESKKAAEAS